MNTSIKGEPELCMPKTKGSRFCTTEEPELCMPKTKGSRFCATEEPENDKLAPKSMMTSSGDDRIAINYYPEKDPS